MDIQSFISEWILLSNSFDTDNYLEKYNKNAILDDASVGRKFIGHDGILEYFTSYFIAYQTRIQLIKLDIDEYDTAHLEVEFSGSFPVRNSGEYLTLLLKMTK